MTPHPPAERYPRREHTSHRGRTDRYARGIVHGAIIGTGIGTIMIGLALVVLLR